jgi:uncharacterized heparinase superfamily protein
MDKVWKTLHTLRYLKFSQIIYRVYYRFCKSKIPKNKRFQTRDVIDIWEAPAYQTAATSNGKTFTFLGQTADLHDDWNSTSFPKLWLYNLHYQDDLNAVGAADRSILLDSMIEGWIEGNPPLKGNGWEPYCISLRSVNWIKWFARKPAQAISDVWINSLAVQVSVLEQLLEHHILANHLFANAKAMVFAGANFGGDEGDRWLEKGLALLDSEIEEQFLPDGGHYELSPMYHSILLWDIADLMNLARLSRLPALLERTECWQAVFTKGFSWLQSMVHPDNAIAFFNDSTFGIAPTLNDLSAYAQFLDIELPVSKCDSFSGLMLRDTGYCVVNLSEDSRLITDVGRVGPDYQPGHAHADTLSCELSVYGQRVFVNSGISQYGEDAERNRQRSTAAHNTVEVDGENSSEVWAGFRVARRAYPLGVEYTESESCIRLVAAHTGYRRLKGKVTHHRTWEASREKLTVIDRLDGQFQRAIGFWHLHPDIDVIQQAKSTVKLELPTGQTAVVSIVGAEIALEDTTWHPGFGESVPNTRIVFNFSSPTVVTEVRWSND